MFFISLVAKTRKKLTAVIKIAAITAISSEFRAICTNSNLKLSSSCTLQYKSQIKGNANARQNTLAHHKNAAAEPNLPSSFFCVNLEVSCAEKLYFLEVLLTCSNIIKTKTNIIKSPASTDAEYESPISNHSLKMPALKVSTP